MCYQPAHLNFSALSELAYRIYDQGIANGDNCTLYLFVSLCNIILSFRIVRTWYHTCIDKRKQISTSVSLCAEAETARCAQVMAENWIIIKVLNNTCVQNRHNPIFFIGVFGLQYYMCHCQYTKSLNGVGGVACHCVRTWVMMANSLRKGDNIVIKGLNKLWTASAVSVTVRSWPFASRHHRQLRPVKTKNSWCFAYWLIAPYMML